MRLTTTAENIEVRMSESNLVGGTDADRKEILRLHEKYIDLNARFDWENPEYRRA